MLFVQEIDLWYRKDVRYPEYANIRNSMKFVPIKIDNVNTDCEVLYQYKMLNQSTDGIHTWHEYYRKFGEEIFTVGSRNRLQNRENLINNIRVLRENGNYKIVFCDDHFYDRDDCFWDNRLSTPKRHGRNEGYWDNNSPFSYTDVVNQTAFTLSPNQYGRVQYNDRYVTHYSDIWYYCIHTLNFINCDKDKFREKMFYRKVPDYEYKNMQYLKYC